MFLLLLPATCPLLLENWKTPHKLKTLGWEKEKPKQLAGVPTWEQVPALQVGSVGSQTGENQEWRLLWCWNPQWLLWHWDPQCKCDGGSHFRPLSTLLKKKSRIVNYLSEPWAIELNAGVNGESKKMMGAGGRRPEGRWETYLVLGKVPGPWPMDIRMVGGK